MGKHFSSRCSLSLKTLAVQSTGAHSSHWALLHCFLTDHWGYWKQEFIQQRKKNKKNKISKLSKENTRCPNSPSTVIWNEEKWSPALWWTDVFISDANLQFKLIFLLLQRGKENIFFPKMFTHCQSLMYYCYSGMDRWYFPSNYPGSRKSKQVALNTSWSRANHGGNK